MSWRLRTSLGETVIVAREPEASRQDPTLRVPAIFVRSEIRDWLLDPHGFDRALMLDMYRELRGDPLESWSDSSRSLQRHVLPVIDEAFRRGALAAFRLPRTEVPADLTPEDAAPAPDSQPADWVELVLADEDGEPYVGPYRIELPGGKVITGQLNLGGRIRVDAIVTGSCQVTFPELDEPSVSAK